MTDKASAALPSVALIGAGAMGGALLRGWLDAGAIDTSKSVVHDSAASGDVKMLCKAHGLSINDARASVDAMVIAVKPQAAEAVLPDYAPLAKDAVVISVMAGKSLSKISEALGGAARLARAMPNLPASIGKGVSGLYATQSIDAAGRALIEILMRAAGDVVWVRNEQEIDLVTAISGSGPAYYFLLTEALEQAGVKLGLSEETAAKLARATLTGAGALLEADARAPAELRRAVTSPGGTTDAALKVFDGDSRALRSLVETAVAAAARRARELTE